MEHSHHPHRVSRNRTQATLPGLLAVFALLIVALAACDTSTNQQLATQPQTGSTETDPVHQGRVRLKFGLGPVGILARTMSTPVPDTVHVEIRDRSREPSRALYQFRLPLDGKDTVRLDFPLDARTSWILYASARKGQERLFAAELGLDLRPGQVVDTVLVLQALHSEYNLRIPCFDGISRVVAKDRYTTILDTNVAGLGYGDTILVRNTVTASPDGYPSEFHLKIHGDFWGTEQLLFQADTTIQVYSGKRQGNGIRLKWAGPSDPPPAQFQPLFKLGEIGVAEIQVIYPGSFIDRRDSGSFVDDRDGQRYDFKRFANQVWMLQNIGAGCDTCDSSGTKFGQWSSWDACPLGWHIPSMPEWQELIRFAANGESDSAGLYRLRSKTGWAADYSSSGPLWEDSYSEWEYNGNDSLGFNLVPSVAESDGGPSRWWSNWSAANMWNSTPVTPVTIIAERVAFAKILEYNQSNRARTEPYAVRCIRD